MGDVLLADRQAGAERTDRRPAAALECLDQPDPRRVGQHPQGFDHRLHRLLGQAEVRTLILPAASHIVCLGPHRSSLRQGPRPAEVAPLPPLVIRGTARGCGGTPSGTLPPYRPSNPASRSPRTASLAPPCAPPLPHLPPGLPRSRQVRDLAILGACHLGDADADEERRQALLEELARDFEAPEQAGVDWEQMREGQVRCLAARLTTPAGDRCRWSSTPRPSRVPITRRFRGPWTEALLGRRLRLSPAVRLEIMLSARDGQSFDALSGRLAAIAPAPLTQSVLQAAEAAMRAFAHRSAGAQRLPIVD